jgi:ABC-type transporter Mla maintaining outer membrane lipid asymmetry ATPase subunit MlaF
VADRLALLVNGKIVLQGTADEFHASEDPSVRAFLERDFETYDAA